MGIAYNEAISQDCSDTIFTEAQLSSHVNLTNVFSSISVTRGNDFRTVFHDIQPATHENRNFAFSETSNFETVFSAAQLTTDANFIGMLSLFQHLMQFSLPSLYLLVNKSLDV